LILILIAALPIWKYSKPFGFIPTIWIGVMLAAHFYSVVSAP
jgi:hypothetical protein